MTAGQPRRLRNRMGWNLFGGLIFGTVGLAVFIYGKSENSIRLLTTGFALMAYPYFVSNTLAMYAIGAALTASLFMFRDS